MPARSRILPWHAALLVGWGCSSPSGPASSAPTATATVLRLNATQAQDLLCVVLDAYDCDGDTRITRVDEELCPQAAQHPIALPTGPQTFSYLHQRSQLAQALAQLALDTPPGVSRDFDLAVIHRDPAHTLLARIENEFWDGLTRVIEPEPDTLRAAARDPKVDHGPTGERTLCPPRAEHRHAHAHQARDQAPVHVYVPASDPKALEAFNALNGEQGIEVHRLTLPIDAAGVHAITHARAHGLLTLGLDPEGHGRPFVVPGGRFNELYGWDSFFMAKGLVHSPRHRPLAQAMTENLLYEVEHYGKVLNANRTYYLTRSQPPFLTAMIEAVAAQMPNGQAQQWRHDAMQTAILDYETVWAQAPRATNVCHRGTCLARYYGEGQGEPPEVEPGHFAWFYQHYAEKTGACKGAHGTPQEQRAFMACADTLGQRYRTGQDEDPQIDQFFVHDRAMRESGHDTTFRWFRADDAIPEHAADFATVDLNALLLRTELDVARWLEESPPPGTPPDAAATWCARARARAHLIRTHLYDPDQGLFFDYDVQQGKRARYLSATTFYPLWALAQDPCDLTLLDTPETERLVRVGLERLEVAGGLAATDRVSLAGIVRPVLLREHEGDVVAEPLERQWEYPYGWAPHQMLAWEGLAAHGFEADAQRLIYRWLFTIVDNAAQYHGTVPEKFDVVARSHQVFAEYGNVNTDFAYIATEGFGWMNASFVVGWHHLEPALQRRLSAPEGPQDAAGSDARGAPR